MAAAAPPTTTAASDAAPTPTTTATTEAVMVVEGELAPHLASDGADEATEEFFQAARFNDGGDDYALVGKALQNNTALADATDAQGRTAAHHAAANGHTKILELLLAAGAVPNKPNSAGNTALHYAATNNQLDTARLLLAKGWKVSATNALGRTVLQEIADRGEELKDMELLLIKHDDALDSYKTQDGASVMVDLDPEDEAALASPSGSPTSPSPTTRRADPASSAAVASAPAAAPAAGVSRVLTFQCSWGTKRAIACSRSTMMRSDTDWTRPAERQPGSLRQSTGERVKPTR